MEKVLRCSSSCDVVTAVSSRRGGLFEFDRSALLRGVVEVVEERDVTEEDEDNEDVICIGTIESCF